MEGLLTILPDGRYELKSFAADEEHNNVIVNAVFAGTHTGEGGPVLPTGKTGRTTFYVMEFQGDRIRQMTKIWHSGITLRQLGWPESCSSVYLRAARERALAAEAAPEQTETGPAV